MSAAAALEAARAAGISVEIDGDDLVLEASAPPQPALLDLLSRHKGSIVALLRLADDRWSAGDWQVFFDERAGIAEFDGGLSRGQAEVRAFECCVAEWLTRNPTRSPPRREDADIWPLGRCQSVCDWGRRVEALSALVAIGVPLRTELPDDFGKNEAA
jgi:hypothetical protein